MHMFPHKTLFLSLSSFVLASVLISVHGFPGRDRHNGHGRPQTSKVFQACPVNERYHRETDQCYPLKLQGPCGEKMMFSQDSKRADYGTCECQDHIGCQYWPFTYWEQENRCYPLFERGPCKENEWLVTPQRPGKQNQPRGRDRNSRHHHNEDAAQAKVILGVCQPRECQNENSGSQNMFFHKGNCYESETQGFCSTDQERMYFTKGCAEPKCFAKPVQAEACAAKNLGGGTIQQIIIATPVPPKVLTATTPSHPVPRPPPPTQPIMSPPTETENSFPKPEIKTLSKSSIPCSSNARLNPDGSCQAGVVL